ncbi:unnamed protein product [Caenorhabditis sp. 36 PRJEB53466]|nr:unnamed protein product [Caenorhabditis sp. 36 PRJEB53466]
MDSVNFHALQIDPAILNSSCVYYGSNHMKTFSAKTLNFMHISISWIVMAVSFISWYLIQNVLSQFRTAEQMTKAHFSLVRVLIGQTAVPAFSVLSVTLYALIGHFDKTKTTFTENLMGLTSALQSVVSPIVTFLFISEYRKALFRIVAFKSYFVVRTVTPQPRLVV